jgi:hypothetical protein
MSQAIIPGIKAKHAIISKECRQNRTAQGAFDEAAKRLQEEYLECVKHECNESVKYHLVLTLERPDVL